MDEIRLGTRTIQPGRQLLVNGRREPIGKRALDILSVLAEAGGGIVTKDELLNTVWPGVTVEENALQVHIVALRKALGPEADRLKTIRGVGYQLDVDGQTSPNPISLAETQALTAEPPPTPTAAAAEPEAAVGSSGKVRQALIARRWLLLAAITVVALSAVWALFGASLGIGSQQRVPVVVRQLSATGPDPTEAALASGITDELIVRLRRIPELRVARAATGESLPGDSFADANIVDGSIRRDGDQLRVTVRLTDPNGEILWSQTFDRRFSDIFAVQEQTAAAIAEVLGVSLDVGDEATDYGGTDNPEAFAAYLEFGATQLNPDQSIPMGHLQRALALDPNYIKALAGVAVSHALQANFAENRAQAEATLRQADEVSQRAIDANPDLWIGHMARAYYWVNREDFAAFDASFRKAAALDKGLDSSLRGALASWALNMGRTREGLRLQRSMEAIEPSARRNTSAVWALSNAGRHEEAIASYNELMAGGAVAVQQFAVNAFLSYLALGREDQALQFADQNAPGYAADFRAFEREEGALSGMSDAELRAWAQRRFGEAGKGQLTNYASFASYRNDAELAVKLLRLAFERPGGYTLYMLWNPVLSNARKTKAFERLMVDIGLAQVWRNTGDWPDACRPTTATAFTCS